MEDLKTKADSVDVLHESQDGLGPGMVGYYGFVDALN